jgi:NadR type nicotinamide-nucleotide adenylyltransferase
MAEVARPFRVCLTGAESTGKSELTKQLARHFSAPFVSEYSREYALEREAGLTYSDVAAIARGQIEREDRALAGAKGLVLLDTDIVSTVVYSRHHFGAVPKWVEEEAKKRLADLYLLLAVDVPWIWDPVRDSGATRDALHDDFRRALDGLGAEYAMISGKWDERLRQAIAAIEAAWNRHPERSEGSR